MAESVKRQNSPFCREGLQASLRTGEDLRLEHFKRIQTTLTALVESHRQNDHVNAEEFFRILIDYEQIHIVRRTMPR
jgi:hypothetical protein